MRAPAFAFPQQDGRSLSELNTVLIWLTAGGLPEAPVCVQRRDGSWAVWRMDGEVRSIVYGDTASVP